MREYRQSVWVYNRPEYIREDEYIEPKKNYTCCGCGAKMEKSELADHARDCQGNKETYLEQTYDKNIDELNEMELMKSLEVTSTKLKSGMKVRLKEDINVFEDFFIPGGHYHVIENCKDDQVQLSNGYYIRTEYIDSIIQEDDKSCPETVTVKNEYTKPKKVKALWLEQTKGEVEYEDLNSLWEHNKYVGFVWDGNNKRYLLCATLQIDELIFLRAGYRANPDQECTRMYGKAYIFESAKDLYRWLAEGEELAKNSKT